MTDSTSVQPDRRKFLKFFGYGTLAGAAALGGIGISRYQQSQQVLESSARFSDQARIPELNFRAGTLDLSSAEGSYREVSGDIEEPKEIALKDGKLVRGVTTGDVMEITNKLNLTLDATKITAALTMTSELLPSPEGMFKEDEQPLAETPTFSLIDPNGEIKVDNQPVGTDFSLKGIKPETFPSGVWTVVTTMKVGKLRDFNADFAGDRILPEVVYHFLLSQEEK